MPCASPEMQRAHKRATAARAFEDASAEIGRVVAIVRHDLDKSRSSEHESGASWSDLVVYAKAGEMRSRDDRVGD